MEIEQYLVMLFSQHKEKHSLMECPTDSCNICERDHYMGQCPSLPKLKAIYKEIGEDTKVAYFIGINKPW